LNTIVPVGLEQVGWVTEETVGTDGAEGTGLIVTVETAWLMQVLSEMSRTVRVYVPGPRPENEGPDWYPEPTLY
jgi:hypothetical protein